MSELGTKSGAESKEEARPCQGKRTRAGFDLNRLVHTPEGQRKSDIVECQGQPAFPFDFPEQ